MEHDSDVNSSGVVFARSALEAEDLYPDISRTVSNLSLSTEQMIFGESSSNDEENNSLEVTKIVSSKWEFGAGLTSSGEIRRGEHLGVSWDDSSESITNIDDTTLLDVDIGDPEQKEFLEEMQHIQEGLLNSDNDRLKEIFAGSPCVDFDRSYIIRRLVAAADASNESRAYLAATVGMKYDTMWNDEFQNLLAMPASIKKYTDMHNLAQSFVFTASQYGKIIIDELYLPNSAKTVKMANVGGFAGGEKFIASGILFKFALDTKSLYRGNTNAMKAAGHELRGTTCYLNTDILGVHVPLGAIIDYRGFRLTAFSLLPISADTLVYGSADGGITVHDSDEECSRLMQLAGEQLHLEGHLTGRNNKMTVYGPGDIEVHRGRDGRIYIVDTARIFPPQCTCIEERHKLFFELLRPELLFRLNVFLSSDAFSMFQSDQHEAKKLNEVATEVTSRLFNEEIPSFAKRLVNLVNDHNGSLPPTFSLSEEMHRFGINMRHLGRVRSHCRHSRLLQELLLREICIRVAKRTLRERLRFSLAPFAGSKRAGYEGEGEGERGRGGGGGLSASAVSSSSARAYRKVIVDFFNEILGRDTGVIPRNSLKDAYNGPASYTSTSAGGLYIKLRSKENNKTNEKEKEKGKEKEKEKKKEKEKGKEPHPNNIQMTQKEIQLLQLAVEQAENYYLEEGSDSISDILPISIDDTKSESSKDQKEETQIIKVKKEVEIVPKTKNKNEEEKEMKKIIQKSGEDHEGEKLIMSEITQKEDEKEVLMKEITQKEGENKEKTMMKEMMQECTIMEKKEKQKDNEENKKKKDITPSIHPIIHTSSVIPIAPIAPMIHTFPIATLTPIIPISSIPIAPTAPIVPITLGSGGGGSGSGSGGVLRYPSAVDKVREEVLARRGSWRHSSFWTEGWNHQMVQMIFPHALTIHELSSDLREQVNLKELFEGVCTSMAITLGPALLDRIHNDSFEFVSFDIIDMVPKIKHMNVIEYSAGQAAYLRALEKRKGPERRRLLELASQKFEAATYGAANNFKSPHKWGRVFVFLAEIEDSIWKKMSLLRTAEEKVAHSLAVKNSYAVGHLDMGAILLKRGIIGSSSIDSYDSSKLFYEAVESYKRAFRTDKAYNRIASSLRITENINKITERMGCATQEGNKSNITESVKGGRGGGRREDRLMVELALYYARALFFGRLFADLYIQERGKLDHQAVGDEQDSHQSLVYFGEEDEYQIENVMDLSSQSTSEHFGESSQEYSEDVSSFMDISSFTESASDFTMDTSMEDTNFMIIEGDIMNENSTTNTTINNNGNNDSSKILRYTLGHTVRGDEEIGFPAHRRSLPAAGLDDSLDDLWDIHSTQFSSEEEEEEDDDDDEEELDLYDIDKSGKNMRKRNRKGIRDRNGVGIIRAGPALCPPLWKELSMRRPVDGRTTAWHHAASLHITHAVLGYFPRHVSAHILRIHTFIQVARLHIYSPMSTSRCSSLLPHLMPKDVDSCCSLLLDECYNVLELNSSLHIKLTSLASALMREKNKGPYSGVMAACAASIATAVLTHRPHDTNVAIIRAQSSTKGLKAYPMSKLNEKEREKEEKGEGKRKEKEKEKEKGGKERRGEESDNLHSFQYGSNAVCEAAISINVAIGAHGAEYCMDWFIKEGFNTQGSTLQGMLQLCVASSQLRRRMDMLVNEYPSLVHHIDCRNVRVLKDDELLVLAPHAHHILSLRLSRCLALTDRSIIGLFTSNGDTDDDDDDLSSNTSNNHSLLQSSFSAKKKGRENKLEMCSLGGTTVTVRSVLALLYTCPQLHTLRLHAANEIKALLSLVLDEPPPSSFGRALHTLDISYRNEGLSQGLSTPSVTPQRPFGASKKRRGPTWAELKAKKVTISDNNLKIRLKGLDCLLLHLPSLTKLNVARTGLSEGHLPIICNQSTKLRSLRLTANGKITSEDVTCSIPHIAHLEDIYLDRLSKVTGQALQSFHSSPLRCVLLSGNTKITDEEVVQLMKGTGNTLEELNVNGCRGLSISILMTAVDTSICPRLVKLCVDNLPLHPIKRAPRQVGVSSITGSRALFRSSIREQTAKELLECFQCASDLPWEHFSAAFCKLPLNSLVTLLERMPKLKWLRLACSEKSLNPMDLKRMVKSCNLLTHLDLTSSPAMAGAPPRCLTTLRNLNSFMAPAAPIQQFVIKEICKKCPNLQRLDIHNAMNGVASAAVKTLANANDLYLTHLIISNCNLHDNEMEKLLSSDKITRLQELNLSSNPYLTEKSIRHLAKCTKMKALRLSEISLNADPILYVVQAMPSLKVLDVSQNHHLTTEGIKHLLLNGTPSLLRVNIAECSKVRGAALQHWAKEEDCKVFLMTSMSSLNLISHVRNVLSPDTNIGKRLSSIEDRARRAKAVSKIELNHHYNINDSNYNNNNNNNRGVDPESELGRILKRRQSKIKGKKETK